MAKMVTDTNMDYFLAAFVNLILLLVALPFITLASFTQKA